MNVRKERSRAPRLNPRAVVVVLLSILVASGLTHAADEKVTIEMWQPYQAPWDEGYRQMVAEFMETYPHIDVILTTVPDLHQKLPAAVAGGAGPDVAHVFGVSNVIRFSNGVLEPIDQYLERLPEWNERDVIPGFLDTMRFRGRIWALPEAAQTTSLVYSKEAFQRAGLGDITTSLDDQELRDYARRLTSFDGDKLLNVGFLPDIWGDFPNWAYHWGGALYDEDAQRITATHPANMAALEWTADLYTMYGGFERLDEWKRNFENNQAALYLDRQGMAIFSSFDYYLTHTTTGGDWEFGVAPPPQMGNPEWSPKGPIAHTDASVVIAGTEHPVEATLLALFNTQMFGSIVNAIAPYGIPSTSISLNRNALAEGYVPEWYPEGLWIQSLETLMKARSWPKIPTLPDYTSALATAWKDVLQGKSSPTAALEDVERTMQALLDEKLGDWK